MVTGAGAAIAHSLHGARNRSLAVELVELDERAFRLLCGGGCHARGQGGTADCVDVGAVVLGAGLLLRPDLGLELQESKLVYAKS